MDYMTSPHLFDRVIDPKVREPLMVLLREVSTSAPLEEAGEGGLVHI